MAAPASHEMEESPIPTPSLYRDFTQQAALGTSELVRASLEAGEDGEPTVDPQSKNALGNCEKSVMQCSGWFRTKTSGWPFSVVCHDGFVATLDLRRTDTSRKEQAR